MATTLQTGSNDDNPKAGSADGYKADGSYQATISGTNGITNAGQKTGQKTGTEQVDKNFPGARKTNPLSAYSSSAYSISLYMVTSEFMNKFVVADPPGILPTDSNGIYVVAQSAGINNAFNRRLLTKNRKLGLGEQGLDYYIEDVTLDTQLPLSADKLATQNTKMTFKIIEPIGFSFLQDLAIASTRINGLSSLAQASLGAAPISIQQSYIIGIRFYGYDVNGNVVNPGNNATLGDDSSTQTDPNSIAERFFPIQIDNITFTLNEKSTVYSCEASCKSEAVAFGEKINATKSITTIGGSTVDSALRGTKNSNGKFSGGLIPLLNTKSQSYVDQKVVKIPTQYAIEWVGGDNNPIAKSLLVDDANVEKALTAMYPVATSDKANVSASIRARTYDPTSRILSFATGTSITEIIDNVIVKSDFISKALNQINNGETETRSTPNANLKELQWYYINPVTEILGRDEATNDWAYKITYQIGVYKIPYIRTQYKNANTQYPGPYKVYNYIYTGENSEVIDFEQKYDNLYNAYAKLSAYASENVAVENLRRKIGSVPLTPSPSSNSNATGGKKNAGSALNENVRAQLYSEGDQQQAKLKIMGDPDWIMSIVGVDQKIAPLYDTTSGAAGGLNKLTNISRQLYGDDYSINPYGGQVFMQIIFGIATDYQDDGLLDVGNDIMFYDVSDVADNGIQGFVYQTDRVFSSFSHGQFTQTFDLVFVPSGLLLTNYNKPTNNREAAAKAENDARIGARGEADLINRAIIDANKYNDADYAQTSVYNPQTQREIERMYSDDDQAGFAPIPVPANSTEARDAYGGRSVDRFGTSTGGAATGADRARQPK